jgi:hypothetical protein
MLVLKVMACIESRRRDASAPHVHVRRRCGEEQQNAAAQHDQRSQSASHALLIGLRPPAYGRLLREKTAAEYSERHRSVWTVLIVARHPEPTAAIFVSSNITNGHSSPRGAFAIQ